MMTTTSSRSALNPSPRLTSLTLTMLSPLYVTHIGIESITLPYLTLQGNTRHRYTKPYTTIPDQRIFSDLD
jgi:hypothetical protein